MIELLVAFVLWESNADWGWWAGYVFMLIIHVIMAIKEN